MNFILTITSWAKQASALGFTYLAGISAIIVTALSLITIIFAQYYDKSAERSNELVWDLREKLSSETKAMEIQFLLRKLAYVGANGSIFRLTLLIFRVISYILAVLWITVGIGYQYIPSITKIDQYLTVISTGLLVMFLVIMPSIFSHMRKRLPFTIKYGGFILSELKERLIDFSKTKDQYFIDSIMSPILSFPRHSSHFKVILDQKIPVCGYRILWALRDSSSNRVFLYFNVKKWDSPKMGGTSFKVKPSLYGRTEENPSLLPVLEALDLDNSMVYIVSEDSTKKFVGRVTLSMESNHFVLGVGELLISTIEGQLKSLITGDSNQLTFEGSQSSFSIKLTTEKSE